MTEIEPYGDALLEMRDVSRSFGETHALTKATLDVRRGQVHALAGENGSGKSTLMKILAGVLRPDSGTIRWKGAETRFGRPRDARVEGISMVFQETLVVPYQSVQDNVVIGLDGIFRHSMDRRTESERARTALDVLGLDHIPLHRLVAELSLAERQLVTVARAIVTPWDLLVLDESTSALDAGARDVLFDYIRAQCAQGRAVLFTSHRMDEVEEIATTTTVLRLGRTVAERPMADTAPEQLLRLMAGQASGEDVVPRAQRAATSRSAADEPVLLSLRHSMTDSLGLVLEADREELFTRIRLSFTDPGIRARAMDEQLRNQDAVAAALADRTGRDAAELDVRCAAAAIIAVSMTVMRHWVDGGGTEDLAALYDRQLTVLFEGLRL